MGRTRTWVLSDLHLGPGTSLTTFRDHDALAALLTKFAEDPEPCELLLAGDTFDFLQCKAYTGFDPSRAVARMDEILTGAGTTKVVEALKLYASKASKEITVLAGNHDPEVLLDDVQRHFSDAIGRRGAVRFVDDVLRAGDVERLPVWGVELGHSSRPVWVAHGDRWDLHNAIHHDQLREAVAKGEPFPLPVGSHLVFEVLAKLKPDKLWIDELKPELSSVIPLLLYLDAPLTMGFLRRHFGLSQKLLMATVRGALGPRELMGPEAQHTTAELVPSLAAAIASAARDEQAAVDPRDLAALERWLEDGPDEVPSGPTLAAHGNVGRWLIRAWLKLVRRTDRFLQVGAPDSVVAPARETLPDHVRALVLGHTHGPRHHADARPQYVNSGTWIPVAQIPAGDLKTWIDGLAENERAWPSEAPRTVVCVDVNDGEPSVTLMSANKSGDLKEAR